MHGTNVKKKVTEHSQVTVVIVSFTKQSNITRSRHYIAQQRETTIKREEPHAFESCAFLQTQK